MLPDVHPQQRPGSMPNAPTAPTQPTLNVTPPTCTVSTGTVTVTSTLTNLTFSSNGTTYTNTNGIFPNIAAGATYSITARNTAGCTSTAATGTMGSAPSTPTRPTVNPTNPTCTVATGTLTVTSSIIGLTFSKDGVDYSNASGIFSNIAAGAAYSITAKNASGCVSSAATGTMGNAPTKPNSPSFRITAPTCSVNTGTITITSSLTNLMFSSDGTNFNNTNGVFTNIPAGVSFSLTAKNSAGCISNPATGTMPNAPTIPNQPILNIDPPTCTIKTGTITVTNSLPNITFSSNGTNFNNTNGIFANIVGGAAYSITAKNAAGCISTAATGIMPLAPIVPTAPILAVTNTCGSSSINASNVTGTLSWSDGGSGNPRVFNTPAANISATQTLNGCISNTSNRVSAAPIAAIPTPTTVSGTNCKAGVVRLSANGSGTIKWYSDQSLSTLVNTGKTYAPNISSTTTYFVTNTVGSCVSLPVSVSGIITNTSNTSSITYDNVCPNRIPYTWNGKTFNSAGTYNVTLTGANGCDSIATLVLQVFTTCTDIYFPNAFSPNGDGTNDKFGPIGNLNNITNYTLSIFNRWGELVFKSNNPFEKWNGTINGQPNDTNNFIWHANYMYNGISKKVKGNIMIVK
jgi:gliding motility-associated-like protein